MKQVKRIADEKEYTAIDTGLLDRVKDYSLIHPKTGAEIKGKLFLGDLLHSDACELSFNSIEPHSKLGYFHRHQKVEEIYLILKGKGCFQLNDDCFAIAEGSVIRVAPSGVRSLSNNSDSDLVYLCIQAKANSLEEHTADDSLRVNYPDYLLK